MEELNVSGPSPFSQETPYHVRSSTFHVPSSLFHTRKDKIRVITRFFLVIGLCAGAAYCLKNNKIKVSEIKASAFTFYLLISLIACSILFRLKGAIKG